MEIVGLTGTDGGGEGGIVVDGMVVVEMTDGRTGGTVVGCG